jgi:outer membrane biosynthesis protein TonB
MEPPKVLGTRSALIVASDEYTDPGLRRLRAPAKDAQALATVLRDPGIGGFEVRTLLNEPAHVVNLAVEEFFADRRPDDLLLVHFSCHGIKDEDGELYFAASNTTLRALGATAVAADFVNRRMNRSRSRRIVLLLDCCYAGAFERGMTARAGAGMGIETQFGGRGRAVITASSAMEYAFEGDKLADIHELQPSVFTSALVEGLATGDADRDQDGMIALDELYDYVYDRVRTATPNQTPGKWTFGVQGDLFIARRARPVTVPAPLPSELQEAIDSPFAAVRAAAVQELLRLLQGRHAGLALAARMALERLTEDDSRMVIASAVAALRNASEQPAEATPLPPPEQVTRKPSPVAEPTPAPLVTARAASTPVPVTATPEAEKPQTETPETERPQARMPSAAAPEARTPAVETPQTAPQTETPQTETPQTETPQTETPQTETPHAETLQTRAPQTEAPQTGILVAGGLAIVGAVLAFLAMFPAYLGGTSLTSLPANVLSVAIEAGVAFVGGLCVFVPAVGRLAGPGFLLGAVATGPTAPIYDIILLKGDRYGSPGPGIWLDLSGGLVLMAAAIVAVVVLVRGHEVRFVRPGRDPLPYLVMLVGVAGAIALLVQVRGDQVIAGRDQTYVADEDLPPMIWIALVAVLIPVVAATVAPRRFGVALLAGWICCAANVVAFTVGFGRSVFGYTLVALLVVTVLLGVRGRTTGQPAGSS